MSLNLSYTQGRSKKHSCQFDDFPPIVERVKTHMKSPIKFERQIARPAITPINAHESRFTSFNDNPSISGKYKRVVSPSFSRSPGRKDTIHDISQITEYDAKIDVVRDRAGSGSPQWKTKQGRKSSLTANTDVTYNIKYHSVDRQLYVPNFEKAVSRPQSNLGKLPSFMVNIASRQGLRLINEKSLRMNKYPEIEYYLPESSFYHSKSVRIEKSVMSGRNSPKN
mmetsp:Transcript_7603/g.14268  ORF Transcript_7603/g.14268 Transcript_7603/m.14268 type:complete len:224 (+) Transcript_7603:4280-4951(+)